MGKFPSRRAEPDESSMAYLTDVSAKDQPWDEHRSNASAVASLYERAEFSAYAERITECSRRLLFALRNGEDGAKGLKLLTAQFCRVRHCPVCQWRRSLMWRARFFKALPPIRTDYPSHRFVFLTLTVRNCELEDLRATVKLMNAAWKKLSARKVFPAVGWIKSVEVTRNPETRQAHPHFHAILMVPASYFTHSYIKQELWRELWRSCLGVHYPPVVNIKVIRGKEADTSPEAIMRAVCETLKYSVKEEDLLSDPEWLAELTRQLHKTRAVAVGGVFKNYFSESDPEDLIDADLEETEVKDDDPEFLFGWKEKVQKYQSL